MSQNFKLQNLSSTLLCTGRGMSKHAIETCRLDGKFFNKSTTLFIGSSGHASLVAEFRPRAYIPTYLEREALSGQKRAQPSSSSGSCSSSSTQPKRGKKLSHLLSAIKSSSDFISVTLSCLQETDTMEKKLVEAVLDTGNHASDFVASRI